MKHSRILIIAPYSELAEVAMKTVRELGKPCQIVLANMLAGVEAAQKALAQGRVEVIISRGGTASLIRQAVNIPVIEIEVTGFDILRALHSLPKEDGPFGIIGFPTVIKGCQTVAQMLGLDVTIFELEEEKETYPSILHSLQASHFDRTNVIIGDTVAVRYAEALHKPFRLITSGPESITGAIIQAENMLNALDKDRTKTALSTAIINAVHEGVITLDKKGQILDLNPKAQELLGASTEILGRPLDQIFPQSLLHTVTQGKNLVGHLESVNGIDLVINLHPILDRNMVLGGVLTLQNALELQKVEYNIRRKQAHKGLVAKFSLKDFIGESDSVHLVLDQAYKYAKTDSSILIQGESGTGKELLAQGIHRESPRKNGPFVAVNCAAIPENLLESELFGYEEGAFTGARKGGKAGLFELAHQGTLFLDEIGELPLHVQARLLRVLQEREVMRIGGDRVIPVDVRLISATHRPLKEAVVNHEFRADLFYRLHVLGLLVPPLRERKGDVRLLMDHFLKTLAPSLGKPNLRFHELVYETFEKYSWPGNVRELRNCVEKLLVLAETDLIGPESLKVISFVAQNKGDYPFIEEKYEAASGEQRDGGVGNHSFDPVVSIEGTLNEIERRVIEKVLELENHNISRAARRLGIDRSTLTRKRKMLTNVK